MQIFASRDLMVATLPESEQDLWDMANNSCDGCTNDTKGGCSGCLDNTTAKPAPKPKPKPYGYAGADRDLEALQEQLRQFSV
jgi:hypothetical protein